MNTNNEAIKTELKSLYDILKQTQGQEEIQNSLIKNHYWTEQELDFLGLQKTSIENYEPTKCIEYFSTKIKPTEIYTFSKIPCSHTDITELYQYQSTIDHSKKGLIEIVNDKMNEKVNMN